MFVFLPFPLHFCFQVFNCSIHNNLYAPYLFDGIAIIIILWIFIFIRKLHFRLINGWRNVNSFTFCVCENLCPVSSYLAIHSQAFNHSFIFKLSFWLRFEPILVFLFFAKQNYTQYRRRTNSNMISLISCLFLCKI